MWSYKTCHYQKFIFIILQDRCRTKTISSLISYKNKQTHNGTPSKQKELILTNFESRKKSDMIGR